MGPFKTRTPPVDTGSDRSDAPIGSFWPETWEFPGAGGDEGVGNEMTDTRTTTVGAHPSPVEERLQPVLDVIRALHELAVQEEEPRVLEDEACGLLTGVLGYASARIMSPGEGDLPACARDVLEHDGLVVVRDPEKECPRCPLRDRHRGQTAYVCRLRVRSRTQGILQVSLPESRALDTHGQLLLQDVARDVALALHICEEGRKRAGTVLQEREHRFRSFVENANDIVYALSPSGRFTYVSPNWMDFVGEAASEVVGQPFEPYVHPDDVHLCQAFLEKVLVTGRKQSSVEYRVKHRDGSWRWHYSNGAPMHDLDGKLVGYMGIARDVTARKEAEEALRRSEARYRSLAENFPDGALFILGRDWRYVAADGKALEQAGLRREDVVGRTPKEVFPELWDTLEPCTERAFQGEEVYYEVEYRGRVYSNQAVLVTGSDGDTEQVIIITQDITERKRVEEALRESEERFRLLLEDIPMVSVQSYAPDGTTLYWNEGSRQIYGYTAEEAVGRNLLDLIIPPEMSEEVREAMRAMAETGEPVPASELSLMRKDGSRVEVYSSHCILQRPGRPQELFCVDIDLSDVKEAEEEREKLRVQLAQAQKMESVGRLAGGVAHDFNNMLNVIMGHTELALDELAPEDSLRADLEEIQSAACRSQELTRQLLAFARRQTVSPRVLDLDETIESMLKMLRRLIGEDIELLWRPARAGEHIEIDPTQIDQLLANLVVNARDAIDGVGTITIETEPVFFDEEYCANHAGFVPGRYIRLTVSDDGMGMDEETMEHIFEPFFTSKEAGEGTGLGLATVYGIVKQNQGFINVYSEPGQGTSFRLYFHVHQGDAATVRDEPPREAPASRGDEIILLVEDEPAILAVGEKMLERLGYTVLCASTPGQAMALTEEREGEIHLLITDVVMPEMNGRELAHRLTAVCPDLRCLFMSGYTADVIGHQGVLEEGVRFIQKPFSQRGIGEKVREALDAGS